MSNMLDFLIIFFLVKKILFLNQWCKGGSRMIKERKLRKNFSKAGVIKDC